MILNESFILFAGLSTGAIVGIAVGSVLVVAVVTGIIIGAVKICQARRQTWR